MDELRVEVGVKESFQEKMLSISLIRAGYVERMGDVKWQRTDAQKREGKVARKIKNATGNALKET